MKDEGKICISILAKNSKELLEKLIEASNKTDLVEVRLDGLENNHLESLDGFKKEVERIKSEKNFEIILTCRMKECGGEFDGSEKEWKEIMERAGKLKFDYIDSDIQKSHILDLEKIKLGSKIIVSYHHFTETPNYQKLKKILKKMRQFEPDIYKFATFVKSEKDNQNLLRLLLNKKSSENVVVQGMGKIGFKSRILSCFLGGEFVFASLENKPTAPGQISFGEVKKILESFNF
jgi:3-dehydroquinate dehydratase type I